MRCVLAPRKTRYKTTSPWRKLLNLRSEWTVMREGRLTAVPALRNRKQFSSSGLVRTHEEHPVVVHNADAKLVKPTGAAKEVSAECRILGEKDSRRKLNAKRLNSDLVLIGCERSSHGPKTLKPAGFNIQSECSVQQMTGQVESGSSGQNRRSSAFIGG
jgi:hypothetical protein